MKLNKLLWPLISCLYLPSAMAQPDIREILALSDSLVQIAVSLPNGNTGSGSGVVVSKDYVATNCHVIANATGASISKYRDSYQPIAMKADWKHDVCLLKFDNIAFKIAPMRDSSSLKYEEDVFILGYPIGNNVPQSSFGQIKATYPMDGMNIIRTNAAFGLGSSGGALFDQDFNLIGITTFKSPGRNGFFYSVPVEWIKQLFDSPDLLSLATNDIPFWALPLAERPYFMQVVGPLQHDEWPALKIIASAWTKHEPTSADAWYYLGIAASGEHETAQAKISFNKAQLLNPRHLDAMIALSQIAYSEHDLKTLTKLQDQISQLNLEQGEIVSGQISSLNNSH
jgi:serine protease Do